MEQLHNDFLIDLMNILPEEVDCYIQAPSLENVVIEKMLQDSDYDYYKLLRLDSEIKNKFIKEEIETAFGMYIQSMEVKKNGLLLFEGFDGVEYGTISNKLPIPEWFKQKYIPDTCTISTEW